ncbi:MAG: hypothetical protein A3E01_07120 [Gammaproteobacteria bacterium RIFCSPHIGHO2_12_FULL_63_22]|nr:MAG: hypothetical protein A3E01_07120 [Gammaproteobacteria bacterium RIFCSPHIGHO2_12_FULL_63_22]
MGVHAFTDDSGATIKIEGRNRQEALALLRSADPAVVERALRVSEKGGLTPQDVTAMLGGQGYKADASGMKLRAGIPGVGSVNLGVPLNEGVAEGLVGAGRTFESWGTGAKQIIGGTEAELAGARHEASARALFSQLDDEGFGAEDIGEALPTVLAAFGGGSLGAGWKALMARGALTGAATEGVKATTEAESRALNTSVGATVGAVTGLLSLAPGALKSAIGSGTTTAKAAVNWMGTLVATAKGNAQTAIFTTSRALSATTAAANQANTALLAAKRAGVVGPGVRTAAVLAQRAQDALGKIIAGMHGKPANQVAYHAANEAFEAGFDATSGVLQFNAAAARNALSRIMPRNVKDFGPVGTQLMLYKQFLRAVENVDDLSPDTIRAAARWIMDDPAAATLVKTVQDTIDPAVKRSLIQSLVRSSSFATQIGGSTELVDQFSEQTPQ